MKLTQVCIISLAKIEQRPISDPIFVLINPEDSGAENIAQRSVKYITEGKALNVMLLINGSKEGSSCPSLPKLKALIPAEKTYTIMMFNEESLMKVAFMMISAAKDMKKEAR